MDRDAFIRPVVSVFGCGSKDVSSDRIIKAHPYRDATLLPLSVQVVIAMSQQNRGILRQLIQEVRGIHIYATGDDDPPPVRVFYQMC